MNKIQKKLERLKVEREVNEYNESYAYREGYVKAMCDAINLVKNLTIPVVKHSFSIDDPIIVKSSLEIRSEHVCSNPLRKPEETDRQLKGYLVELLNSLNGA